MQWNQFCCWVSGLVHQQSSGKIVGFTEMGDINEEMEELQFSGNEEGSDRDYFSKKLAKYINMFMIQGIFSNLECTVGFHASAGFTGDQLFPVVLEATRALESIGFKVRNWVQDGAAPNRRSFFINGLEEEKRGRQYWTMNRYAPEQKFFFISDVPHLLKATRNNLKNSHGNNNTGNLYVSGLQCYYHASF